jgi:hypothetical protein
VQPGILREILLFCRESAKWRLDWSNARSLRMKNFCELSVDGFNSMVKLAGFVEEKGMDRGERDVIGERKR